MILSRAKVADPHLRRDLIIFGKRFTGEMAKDAGLVTKACKTDKLMMEAKRIASDLADVGYDRGSLHGMKVAMYQSVLDKRLKMEQHRLLSKL
jgi:enoyl-CoA hydratase/carnithine racemase